MNKLTLEVLIMEFITYEQPLNEHIRVCLRLEQLFVQVQHWLHGTNTWDSRAALAGILEVLNVLDRPDLKTRLVKELSRFSAQLTRYTETPNVDHSKLNSVLLELNQTIEQLHNLQGRIAQGLRDNDFLISIRQHLTNPGGGCSFDAPAYHYWINQPASERIAQLKLWLDSLKTVQFSINLMLRLIRQSNSPQWRQATSGFYQAALDANISC